MQTFLPYPSFKESLSALDYRRLGKQRVEAAQILKALRSGGGWVNHPATKMWRGYEEALTLYKNLAIEEWVRRGYNNTMIVEEVGDVIFPKWFGNKDFHDSHKSNLLRKNPEFYSQYGWSVPETLEYVWPV